MILQRQMNRKGWINGDASISLGGKQSFRLTMANFKDSIDLQLLTAIIVKTCAYNTVCILAWYHIFLEDELMKGHQRNT